MTLPLNTSPVEQTATQFLSILQASRSLVLRVQDEVSNDVFNALVNLPSQNKMVQDQIAQISASQYTSRIVSALSAKLPSAITVQDILYFTNALDSFAALVEANINLFQVSINPTTKRTEFVTPVSASVKTTIQNHVAAILAEVS